MNGDEIINCIRRIPGLNAEFGGVYMNNFIPSTLKNRKNVFFIINSIQDPTTESFGHWLLVYIHNYQLNYFDSYGLDPSLYGGALFEFIKNYPKTTLNVFSRELQQENSIVCGIYTIFFSHKMFTRTALKNIKSYFGKNRKSNDAKMLNYFLKLTGKSFYSTLNHYRLRRTPGRQRSAN